MPNNRFYKLDYEKQEHILFTALREFMDKSFQAASINQISKKAGLSAGALYYYFDDKEDLLHATTDYALEGLDLSKESLEESFDKYGYWPSIREIIKRRLEFTKKSPEKMRFLQRLILTKDNIELRGQNHALKVFRLIFEYGYDNGYINKDLPKELMFEIHLSLITSINKWELEYHSLPKSINDRLIDNYMIIIKNAIGAR